MSLIDFSPAPDSIKAFLFPRAILQHDANPSFNCLLHLVVGDVACLLAKGIKPTMARLTLARKIAAITLTLWKKGESFDAEKLKSQAA
jgi:hypothetical protein